MAPIAILGAGPSGLVLARILQVNSIDYVVFERDESASNIGQGGSLDIHGNSGQLALKEAGLLEKFKTIARYEAESTNIRDKNGEVVLKFGQEGEQDAPEIDRKDLRRLLLESIPHEKIQWGKRVELVKREDDGEMAIHFAGGGRAKGFRLVVGADGAWSKARNLVTAARPIYSGFHYLTSSIKPENPYHATAVSLAGPGNCVAIGSGRQIAAQSNSDGSYAIVVGLPLPEKWAQETSLLADSAVLRRHLLEIEYPDWNPKLTGLIKHSDSDFRAWPLHAMPVESLSWQSVPGVALIGDAAHVSTPFVGEGVNQAMTDSVQLAQQIIKHGLNQLDVAVAEYEKSMFSRGVDLISRSKASGELLFAPDAPRGFLEVIGGAAQSS